MAKNYSTANNLANTDDVAVGASATEAVVVSLMELTAEDSLNFRVQLTCSAAVEVTGISWKLQHSWNQTEWEDANPGGSLATVSIISDAPGDSDVTTATDKITMTAHGFQTGDEVYYFCDGAGVITGLTSGTKYYAIDSGTNDIQVAATRALAIAGTPIDLTQPSGTDNHYFTRTTSELSLNVENSTDEPIMALRPYARIVATTGSSDVFTVSDVYRSRRF
jgi:hypothetical protein